MKKIFVVDDDKSIRWVLEKALTKNNYKVFVYDDPKAMILDIENFKPDVIISDIRMPGMSGIDMLEKIKREYPKIPIIIMTAFSDLETTVSSLKKGAYDYITKPFDINETVKLVEKASNNLRQAYSQDKIKYTKDVSKIIGMSESMQVIYKSIGKIAKTDVGVLILGKTGTGKELIAKAIHDNSDRKDNPFIAINTGAIPTELLESELFGHEKGSFTGAYSQRIGRFEQSTDGTLFLDEIGDMPIDLQTRLLRVLSEGQFYRVGGQDLITVDVRVIAATHQDLETLVKSGQFREDLFHRLNVIRIKVPPLRERVEDIPLLSQYFLNKSAKQLNVKLKSLSPEVIEYFKNLFWQGNVRQLENICHWLTVMAPGNVIHVSDLPAELNSEPVSAGTESSNWKENLGREVSKILLTGEVDIFKDFTHMFESELIIQALRYTKGRKVEAAKLLGIGRNTITRKIKELEIKLTD